MTANSLFIRGFYVPLWLLVVLLLISGGSADNPQAMLDTDAKGGLWDSYQQAVNAHTQAWQNLLRQCGLMPGDVSG
ncbi:MAG: DUF3080 family protein [Motiliproteus sp.]